MLQAIKSKIASLSPISETAKSISDILINQPEKVRLRLSGYARLDVDDMNFIMTIKSLPGYSSEVYVVVGNAHKNGFYVETMFGALKLNWFETRKINNAIDQFFDDRSDLIQQNIEQAVMAAAAHLAQSQRGA